MPEQKIDDEDEQQETADPKPAAIPPLVITPSPTKDEDNDKNY
jgi:hypothetical protein